MVKKFGTFDLGHVSEFWDVLGIKRLGTFSVGTFRIAGHFGVKEVRDILFGTFRIAGHFGVKEEWDVGNIFGMLRGLRSLDI